MAKEKTREGWLRQALGSGERPGSAQDRGSPVADLPWCRLQELKCQGDGQASAAGGVALLSPTRAPAAGRPWPRVTCASSRLREAGALRDSAATFVARSWGYDCRAGISASPGLPHQRVGVMFP